MSQFIPALKDRVLLLEFGIKMIKVYQSFTYIIGAALLFLFTKPKSQNKDFIIGKINFSSLFGMCAASILALAVAMTLFCNGETIDYMQSSQNILTVKIHGSEYKINQSLLSEMDDMKDEFMIESYVGLSIHNSIDDLTYMLSENFEGDREKALLFVADVTLENLKKFSQKEDKVIKIFKDGSVELSTAINLLIPFIIYESSPLSHQERTLNNIIKGDYQAAVDFYIEDALTRTERESLPIDMKHAKDQYRTSSMGHPITKELIRYLIKNDLAKLDFNKIKDIETREKIESFMKDEPYISGFSKQITKEKSEKWFKIFNTDRLL